MKKLIVTTVILLFAVIAGQAQEKKKGLYINAIEVSLTNVMVSLVTGGSTRFTT